GGKEMVVLLPEHPDESASRLRARFEVLSGVPVGVVISDSFGRPWREGQVNVAIGAAGVVAMRDYRGRHDADGYELQGTELAVVDELWHAGDWGSADVLDGLRRLGRLVVVNGNAPSDPRYPTTIEGTIGRWRVGMVHNLDKQRARWTAGFDVVIHGHTHRFRDEVIGRTRFINPGTATRPQFGGTERTIARLAFEGELRVEKVLVPKFPKRAAVS